MKPNKIKALLGSEKGHKEIEIPFYTKSQVDEKMDKAKELWLKERDTMDKMIEQLLNKNKQLKAKLKSQAKEIFDEFESCLTEKEFEIIKKRWVGKE